MLTVDRNGDPLVRVPVPKPSNRALARDKYHS